MEFISAVIQCSPTETFQISKAILPPPYRRHHPFLVGPMQHLTVSGSFAQFLS